VAEAIIEAEAVVKRFGKVEALAGFDLVACSGQATAVLGPDRAGKTTFVRTVATLIRPDAGRLRVADIDVGRRPEQVRQAIGLAGQYAAVEPTMTVRENLYMVARLFGRSRQQAAASADTVLAQLDLADVADRLVKPTRAACGAGSTSAQAWSERPASCCSTSRPPGWTRAAATSYGRQYATWSLTAPTCCSPRSTWTRPTSSPARWRSSITGGSSPMAPLPTTRHSPTAT